LIGKTTKRAAVKETPDMGNKKSVKYFLNYYLIKPDVP